MHVEEKKENKKRTEEIREAKGKECKEEAKKQQKK